MKQSTDGFTIPELLTVIVIIGVLVAGITSIFISTQNMQARTMMLEAATRAGQRQVEELRNNNYATLTPGEDIVFTDDLPNTLPDNKAGVVKVSEPQPGLRRIDVEITYTNQGRQEAVHLSSMIGILGITR